MKKLLRTFIDLLYPHRCAICDRTLIKDEYICPFCKPKIKYPSGATCMKCSKPLPDENRLYCHDCSRKRSEYERGFAVFGYEQINESLYRFKYGGRPEYAGFYAASAWQRYGRVLESLGIEAYIPVPIHKKRFDKRGYNQAHEFAKCLSKYSGVQVVDDIVIRSKNTAPLKKLGADERQKNLKKAFKLTKNDVNFKKVCIVDDIYTTGATVNTMAGMLKSAGVEKVYFLSVAIR